MGKLQMAQIHSKLIHISVELFSKKITSLKNKKDVRAGGWWITFENAATRQEFQSFMVQTMNRNFFFLPFFICGTSQK